jgi:hypothetical protein
MGQDLTPPSRDTIISTTTPSLRFLDSPKFRCQPAKAASPSCQSWWTFVFFFFFFFCFLLH